MIKTVYFSLLQLCENHNIIDNTNAQHAVRECAWGILQRNSGMMIILTFHYFLFNRSACTIKKEKSSEIYSTFIKLPIHQKCLQIKKRRAQRSSRRWREMLRDNGKRREWWEKRVRLLRRFLSFFFFFSALSLFYALYRPESEFIGILA